MCGRAADLSRGPPYEARKSRPGAGLRRHADPDLAEQRRPVAVAVMLVYKPQPLDGVVGSLDELLDLEATGRIAAPAGTDRVYPGTVCVPRVQTLRPVVDAGG